MGEPDDSEPTDSQHSTRNRRREVEGELGGTMKSVYRDERMIWFVGGCWCVIDIYIMYIFWCVYVYVCVLVRDYECAGQARPTHHPSSIFDICYNEALLPMGLRW